MLDLSTLSPQPLWNIFEELSRIPRQSKHESAAVSWLLEKGLRFGCDIRMQTVGLGPDIGNLLFHKPAFPGQEHRDAVALQAHIDMVCEKSEHSTHDFARDPLELRILGDDLYATDTTLGADNGIGVAAALAVLARKDIAHGPLEVLITVDEETGMTGAANLRPGWLRARNLLNLDSEEEGTLTIGCAGGRDTVATCRALRYLPAPSGSKCLALKVRGLRGGHSGLEINAGRANAIKLLAQVLQPWIEGYGVRLAALNGGNQRNAIPREATAIVFMSSESEVSIRAGLSKTLSEWRSVFGAGDPSIEFTLEPSAAEFVMAEADAAKLLALLIALPHGVATMSSAVPGLVETSTNVGIVRVQPARAEITMLTRSSVDASRDALCELIDKMCLEAGFDVRHENSFAGWKPVPDNPLVKLMDEAHLEILGRHASIGAVHAGLECGIIGKKYPGMQMVSFGPTIRNAHSPEEHVSITSVGNFWELLVTALQRL